MLYFSVTFLVAVLSSQVYDSFSPSHSPQQRQRQGPSHALLRAWFAAAETQMHRALTYSTSSGCGVSNNISNNSSNHNTHTSSFSIAPPRMDRMSSAGGRMHSVCTDPTETLASQVVKGLLKIISPNCMGSNGGGGGNRGTSDSTRYSSNMRVLSILFVSNLHHCVMAAQWPTNVLLSSLSASATPP